MLFFRVCGVRQNLYVYSLYRNPDLDDRIFDCLLASMPAVQAEDVRASFLFVGDLNGHHQEWLGSTTLSASCTVQMRATNRVSSRRIFYAATQGSSCMITFLCANL